MTTADLSQAAEQFAATRMGKLKSQCSIEDLTRFATLELAFLHGANWQREQDVKLIDQLDQSQTGVTAIRRDPGQ